MRSSISLAACRSERAAGVARAISSALMNSRRLCAAGRYSLANVVLPAPFGPATITICGTPMPAY
jgi:hypothetical protein